jgi:flagellar protein FliS
VSETQTQSKKYLEAQIRTASKEQLLLMLYDGAIQNCLNAIDLLVEKNLEKASEKLMKSQNIVAELISSLQFDKNQEVSKNLAALYGYVYIQLMEGNIKQNTQAIQNSIKILSTLRETWVQAFENVGLNKASNSSEVPAKIENSSSINRGGLSIQA